jgi:hypothetical protein
VANGRNTLKQPTCAAHSTAPHLHHRLPHAAPIKLCDEQCLSVYLPHEAPIELRDEPVRKSTLVAEPTLSGFTSLSRGRQILGASNGGMDGWIVQPACVKSCSTAQYSADRQIDQARLFGEHGDYPDPVSCQMQSTVHRPSAHAAAKLVKLDPGPKMYRA